MLEMLQSHVEVNWYRSELCGRETHIFTKVVIFGLTVVICSHRARQPNPDRGPGGLQGTLGGCCWGHHGVRGALATENSTHWGKRNLCPLFPSSPPHSCSSLLTYRGAESDPLA